jgi:hypothetical protein
MSWVTFDDRAPEHRKLVAAGAKACWLWACGLAYCDRQDAKDGFIPKAIVKGLYPGLGWTEAKTLVRVGLWHEAEGGDGYLIHDYSDWRERRFAGTKATRGKAGGSVSSEAKRRAALEREAKRRLAQRDHNDEAQQEHNETTTIVTTTTSPTACGLDPSGISDSVPSQPDPDPAVSFRRRREPGARPKPRDVLLGVRIEARLYVPLDEHWDYGAELGLTRQEAERAAADVRDKFGGKRHDETWLDERLCSFLEQAAKSKFSRRAPHGRLTPADERTQRQLERVAELRAQEAAEEAQKAGAA